MDFLKLLRSFEELLFEVVSWLVYGPRTLWLVLRDPLRMVAYARHEQGDAPGDRYPDTLSPPLLLLLVILLSHGLELAAAPSAAAETPLGRVILGDNQNLLVLRSLLFGLMPLMAAVRFVAARGLPLDRAHLRGPFVGQCYLAAVAVLAISVASALVRLGLPLVGGAVLAAALAWYLAAQARVYRDGLGVSGGRALVLALQAFLAAWLYVIGLAVALGLALGA